MRISRTEYPIWNLWVHRPLEMDGGYTFSPGENNEEVVRALLDEPDDQLTVTATRQAPESDPEPPALLWDSGKRIDDYMLLFSLAQGRNVHYRHIRWSILDDESIMSEGVTNNYSLRTPINGDRPVTPFELMWFVDRCKETVLQPGWAVDTGFIPAIFWYLDSLSHQVVELRFVSAWLGLQALASRYSRKASGNHSDPMKMLTAYRDSREGLGYLTDYLIEFWYELSQDYLTRLPEERYFTDRHSYIYTRKLQLSLELALLESLGAGGFARRESVLRNIRRGLESAPNP